MYATAVSDLVRTYVKESYNCGIKVHTLCPPMYATLMFGTKEDKLLFMMKQDFL